MSDTKTPLWKQLVGGLAGAAVAFVLYEGFTFTSSHLQALVALPYAPGVTHQGELRFSDRSDVYNADRLLYRQQQIAATFGRDTPSTVQRSFTDQKITVTRTPAGGEVNSANTGPQPVYPTGALNQPAPGITPSPSVGPIVSSSSSAAALPSLSTAWLRRLWPKSSSSSSSVSVTVQAMALSSPTTTNTITDLRHTWPSATLSFPTEAYQRSETSSSPVVRDVLARIGTPNTTQDAMPLPPAIQSSSARWTISGPDTAAIPAEPQDSPAAMDSFVNTASSSSAASSSVSSPTWFADQVAPPVGSAHTAMLTPPAPQKHTKLPQTGFGLDILAVTAIGGAIGRRRAMRVKKTR